MFKNILVPVVPANEEAVTEALDLAQKLLAKGGKITLMNVIEMMPAYVVNYMPDGYEGIRSADIKKALKKFTDLHDNVEPLVVHGHSGQSIATEAKRRGADCIVIKSHQPEFTDIFIGSTAAYVVRHAQCSVHVMRDASAQSD